MTDKVTAPFMEADFKIHKLHVGTIAVIVDIISVLVCYYMFGKLIDFNYEY